MGRMAMSTRFMFIGPIGAGKTTLFNSLFGRNEPARKTQVMEFEGRDGMDTPGEYFSHPRLYHALISASAEVDVLMVVHPADVNECRLPPGLMSVYADKCIDAVVTKMDLPGANLPRSEQLLRDAGVGGRVFAVSHGDAASVLALRRYLLDGEAEGACRRSS